MRRLAALVLALLLLMSAGCASLFDTEAYSEEDYEVPADTAGVEEADAISNYAALRRAIARLVADHAEAAELQFQNYDGSISQDLSTACWEVKSSTALGAFAVDYISYDLSRIVSYYQAVVYITYKRSEYQVSAREAVENTAGMRARLEKALRAGETYIVMELPAATLAGDTVREAVEQAYYGDPLVCPVLPAVEAGVYPETGVSRIVEVTMDYGLDPAGLLKRRAELKAAAGALAAECRAAGEAPEALLRALCGYLALRCRTDEAAPQTAWDALVAGTSGSEGEAMALLAVCQMLDIPCQIVFGRYEGEPHEWNIVTLGEDSCHVDVSHWTAGAEPVFLAGDEELWGAYWWDTSQYPACRSRSGVSGASSGEPSPEARSGDGILSA